VDAVGATRPAAALLGVLGGVVLSARPARGRLGARVEGPIAYGLVVVLLFALAGTLGEEIWRPMGLVGSVIREGEQSLLAWFAPAPVATLIVTAALALVEVRVLGALGLPLATKEAVVALGATAALGLVTRGAPGVVAALAVLGLGAHRREPVLVGLAAVFLAAFLGAFYYQLDATLLVKAGTLVATGLLLLGLRVYLGVRVERGAPSTRAAERAEATQWPALPLAPLVLGLVLALGLPAFLVARKEALRADGEVLLLALAPRDPRSLIAGDYMALDYVVARVATSELDHDWPRRGALVVRRDADGLATYVRRHLPGAPLGAGERLLGYHLEGGRVALGAEAFFFQEGEEPRYRPARFGELRAAPSGESLLVGLRDAERRPL
jgi:uncharacterized membrane-anchored protein